MNEWFQFSSIMISVIMSFGFLWKEIKSLETKLDNQSKRTDRLYEMFVDLLKEGRK